MIIRWETYEKMEYSRDGTLIDDNIKKANDDSLVINEKPHNHIWDEKTSGILIELADFSKSITKEQKKQALNLFKELLIKSIELELHLSGSSFRSYSNYHENKIVLNDRGGELGNSEVVFTQMKRVLVLMLYLLNEDTSDSLRPLISNVLEKSKETIRKMIEEMIKWGQ